MSYTLLRFLGLDSTLLFTEQACNVVTFILVNVIRFGCGRNVYQIYTALQGIADVVPCTLFK
ncbi:hypothetical protein D3C80_2221230 [compost metagenome]